MKIAIAGAGIAGAFLARLLEQRGIYPDVYDGMSHDTDCGYRSCGWGAPAGIGPYLAEVGLDPDKYLITPMTSMEFDGIVAETPLWTIDKPGLLRDLTKEIRVKSQYLGQEEADEYQILVDATGISRAFLPPCRSDLTLPTVQHRVVVESNGGSRLPAGVYGERIPGLGYLWVFPLGKDLYHIGVGSIGLAQHDRLLDQFFEESSGEYSFTTLCSCRGVVRVASPYYSTPFFSRITRHDGTSRLVVGTGESIGTVSPFTGEGIVYSLECARILADSWTDPERYTGSVLARFSWMRKERETLDYLLSQGRVHGPRLRDRWRFFRNARRSGIRLPLTEAFKRLGSLSRWMEGPESR